MCRTYYSTSPVLVLTFTMSHNDDVPSAEELAEDYRSSLEDLSVNSRWEITNLTVIAKENIHAAQSISKVIEEHIQKVRNRDRETRPLNKLVGHHSNIVI